MHIEALWASSPIYTLVMSASFRLGGMVSMHADRLRSRSSPRFQPQARLPSASWLTLLKSNHEGSRFCDVLQGRGERSTQDAGLLFRVVNAEPGTGYSYSY